jgi:hypothetical protein
MGFGTKSAQRTIELETESRGPIGFAAKSVAPAFIGPVGPLVTYVTGATVITASGHRAGRRAAALRAAAR